MYIQDRQGLVRLVERLRGVPRLALDTEFVRDQQYYPRLEIVQVATPELAAIIDFRALRSLEPFTELLTDEGTLKLFHAGGQDLEIFFNLMGRVPAPLFDTQVAAAMVGLGAQVGYSRLVETLLEVTLAKSETLTDWSRRPLSAAQKEYALDDVRYLLPLHDELQTRLNQLGRTAWLDAEWRAMEEPASYERTAPHEAWRRVQGMSRLRPRELAVLRELAAWREQEGIRRDRAPSLIARDNILLEIVRRSPSDEAALEEIRGLHPREIERQGHQIVAAVARGLALPRDEWPRRPERNPLSEQESSFSSLLQGWLRARADELAIAPNYLATSAELKELVACQPDERQQLPILRGWRRRLVGDELVALLEGRASLVWEPQRQTLRLVPLEAPPP